MKIISGGQTGVDRAGLDAARLCDIETGGYAPKGYLTEIGRDISLVEYGLEDSGLSYVTRTNLNVEMADVTIWFGNEDSAGYKATKRAAKRFNKPFINCTNMDGYSVGLIIIKYNIINVAGNRESVSPGIGKHVREILIDAFRSINNEHIR